MSDKEWNKLWEMSEKDLLEVWGLSKEELEVIPYCPHLAECSNVDCVCCDCKMYTALTDNWFSGDRAEEMYRARVQKVWDIKHVLHERIAKAEERVELYEVQRERIALIRGRMALYVAKMRSLDKQ